MPTTSADALTGAALAQGRTTQLSTLLVDPDDARLLSPDPWAIPDVGDQGFIVQGTIAADVFVSLHANARARSCWLVVDPDNAPLTGDYIAEVDGTTVTHAASEASVAEVLEAWAAAIEAAVSTVTAEAARCRSLDGAIDGIRITAVETEANLGAGLPAGVSYASFDLDTLSAPAGAELWLMREVTSASLRLWGRAGQTRTAAVADNITPPLEAVGGGWVVPNNGEVGALTWGGYDERVDMASRSALAIQLHTLVAPDTLPSLVTSGAGLYGVTNLAWASVSPAIDEAP